MLRDFKFLRRNSGKTPNAEEIENVPVNHPGDSSVVAQMSTSDSSRHPLNTIQEPIHNPKSDRTTPTKPKGRYSDSLRTPEKIGASARTRFGWGPEAREVDSSNYTGRGLGNVNTPRSCRTAGRANSECNSTQSTPTKSVSKPPNPGLFLPSGSRPPTNGGARMANFTVLSKGVPAFGSSSTIVNSIEVPHFNLKEDPSFWMDHNVQVLIRIRPLNDMEKSTSGYSRCLKQESAQCVNWIGHPETRFTFDHVACETIDQETIFRMVGLPMVENCLSGYNSCMFAYGQTGSGKTHTMLGEINELEVNPSPNRGITPRMFEFLFARIIAEEESRRDERLKYSCKCSFLEIYNEQITDLLDPSSTNLQLREDTKKGVYVENLSEFEVHTVSDILQLLSQSSQQQGSSNRKVAATNMNRESSRSHSVFTCVIESRWEKDSASNLRFARLNLVDLAGSERQKTSGAEGDRLKEAANINKSLSTLGHVIMVLVDVCNAKIRHIPYRDSRLTFLLQDSLGGNSKTMIIANVSPSICCAAETLNTLKFAQRAKLIQNNAVVNEDSSGDVKALQHQIRLLKEELSALKRHNISRSSTFDPMITEDSSQEHASECNAKALENDDQRLDNTMGCEVKGSLRFSSKQLKSLETTLIGALRREKMAETSIKQLEAEMEQLNRLVRQREEDARCTKMMLKFREDKIQRMESVLGGLTTADAYLLEENNVLTDEIQMLRSKLDRNPEVTHFARENIRLLEQLRRFQDFYEDGERELLLAEVSELRDQLFIFLDEDSNLDNHLNTNTPSKEQIHTKEKDSLRLKLKTTLEELEECKNNLNSCLEINANLSREIFDLNTSLKSLTSAPQAYDGSVEVVKESILEAPLDSHSSETAQKEKEEKNNGLVMHTEDILNLQLEVDILRIILKEERSSHSHMEEKFLCLNRDLKLAEGKVLSVTNQFEVVTEELMESRSVIEALESQQLLSIAELEDLKRSNEHYAELLHQQKLKINSLNEQIFSQVLRDETASKLSENDVSPLQAKLNKMQGSLQKAKRLNMWYQTDQAYHASSEEDMEEVRKQVEGETAEVIVCLQEELGILQQQVHDSAMKERETEGKLMLLQTELKELQEKLYAMTRCNQNLSQQVEDKEKQLRSSIEEWELLTNEIGDILAGGHEALEDASKQLNKVSGSFPQRRTWFSEQLHKVTSYISEKELLIDELNQCLEDANKRQNDLDCMLRSLRGAALVINEAHLQDWAEKEKEILLLVSQLSERNYTIVQLENKIKQGEEHIRKASVCATVAFVIVNRFSEMNIIHEEELKYKDVQLDKSKESIMQKEALLQNQAVVVDEAEKQIQSLQMELKVMEERCADLNLKLSEEKKRASLIEGKLDEFEESNMSKTRERLAELKDGVSAIKLCMNEYAEQVEDPVKHNAPACACTYSDENCETRTGIDHSQGINKVLSNVEDSPLEILARPAQFRTKNISPSSDQEILACRRTLKDTSQKDTTIMLLKKEIESALESFKGVQTEMVKLHSDKLQILSFETQSRKSIESLVSQIHDLQTAMNSFEEQFGVKMVCLDHKIQTVEESLQESRTSWFQKKRLYELELGEAKIDAAEKAAESSCILAAFEEAQHTIREADIMINELMIANETMKLEIDRQKKKEVNLVKEKEELKEEVHSLQTITCQKDLQWGDLEEQFEVDVVRMKRQVEELENLVLQVQTTFEEALMSISSDFFSMKSQLHNSSEMVRSALEDIWSEIIVKDCSVSVLHVCNMGILLETVTGLNVENGLLYHGLCESNSVVSELREHNFKSMRELEMCRILKGKLLSDIKSSFDCISRKEEEIGKLWIKLSGFEKRIEDLQLQEEVMLQRSNYMGSELTILMKELDLCNNHALASLLDQTELLKDKDEQLRCQEEKFMIDAYAKDVEVLLLASELEQMALQKSIIEKQKISIVAVFEKLKEELIIHEIDAELKDWALLDKEVEVGCLMKKIEVMEKQQVNLYSELDERSLETQQLKTTNTSLEQDIQLLKDVACSNDSLKNELIGLLDANMQLSSEVQKLGFEYEKLQEDSKLKETAVKVSSDRISVLHQKNQMLQNDIFLLETSSCKLQNELEMKDIELKKMSLLEKENESLAKKLETESCTTLQDLEKKKSEVESSLRDVNMLETQNHILKDQILCLESSIINLQNDLEKANVQMIELHLYQSVVEEELCSKAHDLQIHVDGAAALKEENHLLKNELKSLGMNKLEVLNACHLHKIRSFDSVESVDKMTSRVIDVLNERSVPLQSMFQEICKDMERVSTFIEEFECLENLAKEVISKNLDLQTELKRKDEVLEGLVFDLRLLQESASNTQDKKDEIEGLTESLEAIEIELDEAVAKSLLLEDELQNKISLISTMEFEVSRERERVKLLSSNNCSLTANLECALKEKTSIEEELRETRNVNERLEVEIVEMGSALSQMNNLLESLTSSLASVSVERDDLLAELLELKKEFDMAQALAEENEAIATEARQVAETRTVYAEDKEEEVKLLEKSVEELESTVNVLESKVDMVKGEAERQRLQREELELEFHAFKQQMNNVKNGDTDLKRHLDEKEKTLHQALHKTEILEKEIATKDAEIAQCKAHISELNLHAEAQAQEYKQTFKALETMADQVKPDSLATHISNSSTVKLEKNGSKSRGSGSPFKCIGLGLTQQMKSERDEELMAGRLRIEELEALAASRQKEIFMLHTRLAAAESMTHDVIRDLLGLKSDMTSYASLLDNQQMLKIAEQARLHNAEAKFQEQEVIKLKQQLSEHFEEKKGWLDEIDRKQAELVAAQISLEKLHQRDRFLATENEMFKMEIVNHKKVMELEAEVKKLSGQQNLQQRIHHHAKIKEENNLLKVQNEDLSCKLQRKEAIITRVKEELSHYRAANGRSPYAYADIEQQLNDKLKETEEERLELAQKLVTLCTSILKASGITRPSSDISLSMAEEALDQLHDRVTSLNRELQDLKYKNRINNERSHLSELRPQPSPLTTPNRVSQTTFLSALDR